MGRPTATPQRSTGLTASCRKAPRFSRSFLSSGTAARQRLRQGIVSFAREIPRFRAEVTDVGQAFRLATPGTATGTLFLAISVLDNARDCVVCATWLT